MRFINSAWALFAFTVIVIASPVSAEIITVADGQSIQAAIEQAVDGDTITVAAGTFNEDINFQGKAITVLGVGEDTQIIGTGAGPVVSFVSGETMTSVLDSVEVRGGLAPDGGGVLIKDAAPKVLRSTIKRNKAESGGSGIYISGTDSEGNSAVIMNNLIARNTAVSLDDGDPHNLQIINSSPTIVNNTIIRGDSNGIFVRGDSVPVIQNNIIAFNGTRRRRFRRGRGICFVGLSSPESSNVQNNLFFRNTIGDFFLNGEDFRRIAAAQEFFASETIANNLRGNPRFRRLSRLNVKLRRRSGAIDAANGDFGSPAVGLDLDGSATDIGVTGGQSPHQDFI